MMRQSLKKIIGLFTKKEKKKFYFLLFMMIVAAFFETLGIGLIIPLIGIITDPAIVEENAVLSWIYQQFGFQSYEFFVLASVGFMLSVFFGKNLYLLLYQYFQFKMILNFQVKLSKNLFKNYLTKPYTFHLQRNTSILLRNVNEEVPKVLQGILLSSFQLATEALVIICILSLLLYTSPVATIAAGILLGGSMIIFHFTFRQKISSLGKEQQIVNGSLIQWVNQGLGAAKEVKVSGREGFFVSKYREQSKIKASNSLYMKVLEQVPRLFIESMLVAVVLVTLLIIVFQGKNTAELISIMALFAMAAFRLMPSITRVVALIATIRYSQPALDAIYDDLKQFGTEDIQKHNKKQEVNKSSFKHITLNNVFFSYPDQAAPTIQGVSLEILRGQSVAFIGTSGAGKTTIVDIMLGLLEPFKGEVKVNQHQLSKQISYWQKNIGYIPQFIFLSDDTIRANVAFGLPEKDVSDEMVWNALEKSQLKEFVLSLPEGLDTSVGERGVRLSGGQRQRIGIARALYHDPEILFMDEATSALDHNTEKEIMKSIDLLKGDKTIIIIAHRLSTIENCDVIFTMEKGHLKHVQDKRKKVSV
ncbi:ABC transporter-like protein [Jeotgalibacillus malaysiensis]|uniref:ABC transporter-like protein n=1 Tax=Jeotgalibacillus malaysiensis TaxID=1508404 RepID=A0A0B5ARJ7_9BACL|nr:ABC transporter ATP-binding protein [Jeotgalibacillus malaysiensis]AJD92701.1 ABC transporter-like protein [Jeotgalibacillus malaysiensis]